jgi:2-polyprenyl-6-methoxyphenol hydroxylase-like FAD-dependent oxidoreductase
MIYGRTPITPDTPRWLPEVLVDSFNNLTDPDGMSVGIVTCRTREPGAAARLAPDARLTEIPDYLAWTIRNWPGSDLAGEEFRAADGATLHRLACDSVRDWHPAVRRVMAEAEIPATFPVTLRAARPVTPWHTTNVTLLGDAIHTMSPSCGEGANITLRDARLLRQALVDIVTTGVPLGEAKAGYESEMLRYGFLAVAQSLNEPLFRRTPMPGTVAGHAS